MLSQKDRALLRAGFIAGLPSARWEGLLPVELCNLDLLILVVNGKTVSQETSTTLKFF